MKVEWNSKYKTISVYTIITVTILVLIVLFFVNLQFFGNAIAAFASILMPFIVGFAVAYLLYRPASSIEKHWFAFIEKRKPRPGLRRALSIFTLFVIVFGIVIVLVYFIIPQLFQSVTVLLQNLPMYLHQLEGAIIGWLRSIDLYTPDMQQNIADFQDSFLNLTKLLNSLVAKLPNVITTVGTGLFNFFVGMIVCVYVLYSRERFLRQMKKIIFAVFKIDFATKFMEMFHYSNNVFLGFIIGTLTSSAFVGISTFIFMSIVQMPYAILIAVIIALTNIVPFFGPFLGAIPSLIILFIVDPIYALIFLIFILALQQIDGNIIMPKLIGMHVGISAFWVLFALIAGGGLFGFWGLVLGVPVFAVIYSLVSTIINNALKRKGVPETYYNTPPDKIVYSQIATYHQKRAERQKRTEEWMQKHTKKKENRKSK